MQAIINPNVEVQYEELPNYYPPMLLEVYIYICYFACLKAEYFIWSFVADGQAVFKAQSKGAIVSG